MVALNWGDPAPRGELSSPLDVFHQKSGSQISGFDAQQRGGPGLPENQIPKKISFPESEDVLT
jgi:hypothetical protein